MAEYHSELLFENECKKISLSTLPQFPLFYLHFYIPSASVYQVTKWLFFIDISSPMQKCDKRGGGGGGGLVGIRGSSLEDDEDVFEEPGHHHRRSR